MLNVMAKFGIQSTTDIKEPGMSVWVVEKVKVKIDELKFRPHNKIECRAFTNAALELVFEKHGGKILKALLKVPFNPPRLSLNRMMRLRNGGLTSNLGSGSPAALLTSIISSMPRSHVSIRPRR